MKLVMERKYINLLLMAGIALMFIFTSLSSMKVAKSKHINAWILHSHHVIETIDKTIIQMNSLDSAIRGYFITKDKSYLNEFKNLKNEIKRNLERINILVDENPEDVEQKARVDQFERIISLRIADMNMKLDQYHKYGLGYLLKKYDPKTGIIKPREIRNVGFLIVDHERNMLNERINNTDNSFTFLNILIISSSLSSLILILFGVLALNKQIDIRKKMEKMLRKSENDLYQLAYHDPLTGLANRLLLYNIVESAIISSKKFNRPFAILYIDIDNFKNVNDSLGHEIGDQLLKQFSQKIQSIINAPDTVSRIGGDEFMIVINEFDDIDDLQHIAKKILKSAIMEPISIDHIDKRIFITASIGISIYPDNGQDPNILIKNADIAMYHAKDLGKNNYQFCSPEMANKVEQRLALEYHLHHAVSNDEFSLSYQPIISLQSNDMVAVEALIRWNKPNEGVIYPSDFIMIAETSGLIVPIGAWLLRKVCHDAAGWHAISHQPITVAINISIRQFILSDFVTIVKDILRQTQFNPRYLEFEITESVLLENSQSNMEALSELKNMGITITIDDFGTGYSSLSYLQSFSVDKVKIDKSFINQISPDNQASAIIKAIITMAHSLGIKVIAEGVEHEHHIMFLKEHACDEAQGYYFSHPIKSDDFHDLVRQRRNPMQIEN